MRTKEELDLYIETSVMNRVKYKRKLNVELNEEYYEGTYKLSFFERDNIDEDEIEYIFDKLKDKNITIVGNSPVLYGNFENYKYVKKPMFYNQKEKFDEDIFNQLMNQYKMLNQDNEEEKEKASILRKKIIAMNVRLADFLVYRYNSDREFENDELLSYAYEGLIVAFDNYNKDKGPFSTFAIKCIEGHLIRGMQKLRGFSSVHFYYKYKHAKEELEEELNSKITDDLEYLDEIAKKIYSTYKLHLDTVYDIKTKILLMNTLSLEEIGDSVYDDNTLYQEVIEKVNRETLKSDVDKMLSELTDREKEVMIDKYGFKDDKEKENKEVAENMKCQKQNIYEIEKRSINKLRKPEISSHLKEYYAEIGEYDYSPTGIEQVKVKQKSIKSK